MRNYGVVTASYWCFTLTDGALRMLVLLHFYALGYTPFMLAFLFLLYETAGIFANLGGGWLATRFGIPRMLMTGLGLQITGLMLLSALDPTWSATLSVTWVVAAQGIASGPVRASNQASSMSYHMSRLTGGGSGGSSGGAGPAGASPAPRNRREGGSACSRSGDAAVPSTCKKSCGWSASCTTVWGACSRS